LVQKVEAAGTPIFIAVLPDSAREETGGDINALGGKIVAQLRQPGTYMVTAGTKWTAASNTLDAGQAQQLGRQAFAEHGRDLDAALGEWVDQVGAAAGGEPVGQAGDGGGGAGSGIATVAVLTAVVVGGGALIFVARRRRREREAERRRQLEEVKTVAQEDLVALADDIRALALDTRMPDADPEALR